VEAVDTSKPQIFVEVWQNVGASLSPEHLKCKALSEGRQMNVVKPKNPPVRGAFGFVLGVIRDAYLSYRCVFVEVALPFFRDYDCSHGACFPIFSGLVFLSDHIIRRRGIFMVP